MSCDIQKKTQLIFTPTNLTNSSQHYTHPLMLISSLTYLVKYLVSTLYDMSVCHLLGRNGQWCMPHCVPQLAVALLVLYYIRYSERMCHMDRDQSAADRTPSSSTARELYHVIMLLCYWSYATSTGIMYVLLFDKADSIHLHHWQGVDIVHVVVT